MVLFIKIELTAKYNMNKGVKVVLRQSDKSNMRTIDEKNAKHGPKYTKNMFVLP